MPKTTLDTIEKATYLPNPENFGKGKKHAKKTTRLTKTGFKSIKRREKASHARRVQEIIMELDLTKKADAVTLMKSSKDTNDWNKNCDRVLEANNGEYPCFWCEAIIQSSKT